MKAMRVTKSSIVLKVCILLLGISGNIAHSNETSKNGLTHFWMQFQSAVQSTNTKKIQALTTFPFELKGEMDDAPIQKYNKKKFLLLLPKLLSADSGTASKPIAMKDLILKTANVKKSENGEFQLGIFVFRNENGRWSWIRAYYESDAP